MYAAIVTLRDKHFKVSAEGTHHRVLAPDGQAFVLKSQRLQQFVKRLEADGDNSVDCGDEVNFSVNLRKEILS